MTRPDLKQPRGAAADSPAGANTFALALLLPSAACLAALLALAPVRTAKAADAVGVLGNVAIFDGADLALGEQLIDEHACEECHARNAGGDGKRIYRPMGRINSPGALRGMVEYCNTQLNLGMFPEEVTAVAAVLQRDYYRFR
ncbi:MAG: hypothetical protein RIQ60_231 [Pseudomonadota bacterium]|jgi:cytochrome c peroxidase